MSRRKWGWAVQVARSPLLFVLWAAFEAAARDEGGFRSRLERMLASVYAEAY
jgi:hypothetical protein